MKLYCFGWPGRVGGADTKLAHLLPLLSREYEVTVVPIQPIWLLDPEGRRRLDAIGVRYALLDDLPLRLDGWAVSLCNDEFLTTGQAGEARRRGLKIAWSNEMMCLFPSERGAVTLGLFDAVLYVSEAQRRILESHYARLLSGQAALPPFAGRPGDAEGWIAPAPGARRLRWVMTGNYIDPAEFPYRERGIDRAGDPVVVGRLSRPDPAKFPPEFPRFYEGLGLRNARFRVMAWSEQLARQWTGHSFDSRWELLPALAESPSSFLQSLDLFVYSLHPVCRESWGRVAAEAMLSGAVALLPADESHHLRQLIAHGETGFLCGDAAEFGTYARLLEADLELRRRVARAARRAAELRFCDTAAHLGQWRRVFYGAEPREAA